MFFAPHNILEGEGTLKNKRNEGQKSICQGSKRNQN